MRKPMNDLPDLPIVARTGLVDHMCLLKAI